MTNKTIKPTSAFWIISVLALLWNIMGVAAYLGQAYMTEEVLKLLPQGEQDYHNNVPAWVTAVFATAVFAGVFGCVGLLMRKKWAVILFLISIIAVIAQSTYNLFIQEFMEVPFQHMIWSLVVILIAIFLVWFSRNAAKKNWLS
jgi:FtsH-binding integral membrane protein